MFDSFFRVFFLKKIFLSFLLFFNDFFMSFLERGIFSFFVFFGIFGIFEIF